MPRISGVTAGRLGSAGTNPGTSVSDNLGRLPRQAAESCLGCRWGSAGWAAKAGVWQAGRSRARLQGFGWVGTDGKVGMGSTGRGLAGRAGRAERAAAPAWPGGGDVAHRICGSLAPRPCSAGDGQRYRRLGDPWTAAVTCALSSGYGLVLPSLRDPDRNTPDASLAAAASERKG